MVLPAGSVAARKAALRGELLAARRRLTPQERAAEAAALARHVVALGGPGTTVCGYVPVGTEPGTVALLDALAATGARVLLPVAREPGPLSWVAWTGEAGLVAAPMRLREPAGEVLPPAALAGADVVLVPALAVDRAGRRLGRGAGFYDRSLGLARPGARLVGVVRDAEVRPEVPAEGHDVALGWLLTPGGGLVEVGPAVPWHSAE
ncbi:hypothetical protein GCM10027047_36460 [Rhodococcus aerolatus]